MQDRREDEQESHTHGCIKRLQHKVRPTDDRQERLPGHLADRSPRPLATRSSAMREERPEVQQGSMILPYFNDEVTVLYLADGTGYIPVVALCRMLGLSPETHIPRWRRLFLWEHARKLPLRTEKRGMRMVWCLHLGALLFWCSSFNWSLVSPERRIQLREATDAGLKHLEQAHQEMLTRYRQTRHLLFRFLTNYADAQTQLQQVAARMHRRLDVASSATLDSLLAQGNALIEEATTHARAMPQDQASIPIMDVVTIDTDGYTTEAGSLPLFPVIPEQDCEQFFAQIDRLTHWYGDFVLFLVEHGLSPQENHDGEE